jgi:hypothetical protein
MVHVFLKIQSNIQNSSVQNGSHIPGRRAHEAAVKGTSDTSRQEVGGGK